MKQTDLKLEERVSEPLPKAKEPVDYWTHPVQIAENNFKYKSLSNWALNFSIGCSHACVACYVPSTSANKQVQALRGYGVQDPDAEWGRYVLLRPWDEARFLSSLRTAERKPRENLKADGNRAVLLCTTTDPYQTIHHERPERQRELAQHARSIVRRSLELIRDHSTLNVRILTRSPLAREDFDLMRSFGPRLLFGMSLPTLNNQLARIYEPKAPSPSARLRTLEAARKAGLSVYVAMAPTYPECDEADMRATLRAIRTLDPVTTFHEPVNVRAENVARIAAHAREIGQTVNTAVFETRETWEAYALGSLRMVERLAGEEGLAERLHLWPDQSLGTKVSLRQAPDPEARERWLQRWWNRISEWPT